MGNFEGCDGRDDVADFTTTAFDSTSTGVALGGGGAVLAFGTDLIYSYES